MDTNVKAVDAFDKDHDGSALVDCEYIEGSSVPNQLAGVFWSYLASLFIIFQTIILSLSELGWHMAFFDRYFPVLGSNFGLGILGIFQCLISTQILSHFVEDFTLVSAFFLFVLGCLNILLGLIFRESAKAKRAKVKDILRVPTFKFRPVFNNKNSTFKIFSSPSEITPYVVRLDDASASGESDNRSLKSTEKAQYGFGRQGEKSAPLRGFTGIIQKPVESLPRYMAAPSPVSPPTFRSRPNAT